MKYEKGKIVRGTVTGIESYGIFVTLDEYYSGLIHISEISCKFVNNISDYVNIGETIYVKILDDINENHHLKLSIKEINYKRSELTKKNRIVETKKGFTTLAYKLPIWIKESLEKNK